MAKKFEQLIKPVEFKIGSKKFYTSTIPAFYAQRIMLNAGEALANLDVSKIPESTILEILSYSAFENENGIPVVLDGIEIINQCVESPKELIELEMKVIEENFGFFFDGSLREVFQPLLKLITSGTETSTP